MDHRPEPQTDNTSSSVQKDIKDPNLVTEMPSSPAHLPVPTCEWLPRPNKPDQSHGLPPVDTIAKIRIDGLSHVLHSSDNFDDWYWEAVGTLRKYNLEVLIEIETPRPQTTSPLTTGARRWVKASVLVAKWLRGTISAGLMERLRSFSQPMSLADDCMNLIWGYMDFHQVSVDFDRFNRFENLNLSDFARGSQYVEAFGQSYLRLQRRALAPAPYHAALRLLYQIGMQYPFLRDAAIAEMERERMCANAFSLRQLWRTVEFLVQQLRYYEAAGPSPSSGGI